MEKTAVEWLVDELNNIKAWTKNVIILSKADILIGQAKEMEKQQQGYSEEEVLDMLYKHTEDMLAGKKVTLEEWFKQFKNK